MTVNSGDAPFLIDLFSGAGGLSLGAARAGFKVVGAVETDTFANSIHTKNFPSTTHIPLDVSQISGRSLLSKVNLKAGGLDGLIGGPPCQGFSFMGHKRADDIRNHLFVHFFRLVKETKPRFFVAENVPGILCTQYDAIRSEAFSLVQPKYRIIGPIHINASLYGAPTTRTRVFFIGVDSKRVTNELDVADFLPSEEILPMHVIDALDGLPIEVSLSWQKEPTSWQKISALKNERVRRIFSDGIPQGVGDRTAIDRLHTKSESSGFFGTIHGKDVVARFEALGPGQKDEVSRSMRLDPNGFCPTIRAGTDKTRGSYQAVRPIHFSEPRVITPREAARLQGFPDWFVFHPTKWHSFRQIGNSVSPIVSEFILGVILSAIK